MPLFVHLDSQTQETYQSFRSDFKYFVCLLIKMRIMDSPRGKREFKASRLFKERFGGEHLAFLKTRFALANEIHGYTDKTHLRGFQILRVRLCGLRLCRRDF